MEYDSEEKQFKEMKNRLAQVLEVESPKAISYVQCSYQQPQLWLADPGFHEPPTVQVLTQYFRDFFSLQFPAPEPIR